MSLPKEFTSKIAEKTDRALFDILQNSDDYLPEAIGAARTELARRGVCADVPPVPTALDLYRKEVEAKASAPLEVGVGIVIMLTVFISPLLFVIFLKNGYRRKARDAWTWAAYGLGLYMLIGLIGRLLS